MGIDELLFEKNLGSLPKRHVFFAQNVTENVPFWQLPEFFSKSSSSTPIFYSINQKMTSISSFTAIFTNFVDSVFVQLKLEHSNFYKNRYFSMKSALYATLKQQEGIKLHIISKINISTTALNQVFSHLNNLWSDATAPKQGTVSQNVIKTPIFTSL